MPLFIILCLMLAVLAQNGGKYHLVLSQPWLIYLGLVLAISTMIGSFLKKIPEMLAYDLFSSFTLVTWYALWKPLFVYDSPIFFFFPVYFAIIAALGALFFTSQRHNIDQANLKLMQSVVDSSVVEPWLVMVLVLITLYFDNHFLQYPVLMTLLTTRFILSGCLLKSPKG